MWGLIQKTQHKIHLFMQASCTYRDQKLLLSFMAMGYIYIEQSATSSMDQDPNVICFC